MKVKFITARGSQAAGSYGELPDAEATAAINAGEVMPEALARQFEARDAELATIRASQKAADLGKIEAACVRAVQRRALVPKGDSANSLEVVKAAQVKRYERIGDADIIVELIDALRGEADDKYTRRVTTQVKDDGGDTHVFAGETTPQEACRAYIQAREGADRNLVMLPHDGASKDVIKAAADKSAQLCALLKQYVAPVFNAHGSFGIRDIIRAVSSDVDDPNSQVGTLSSTLQLMRNLGFLKNKISFMPYVTTDLRNEPAKFGQNIQTRYITPPGVLTFCAGTGYTSDATTISNYIASRGTNLAAVGPSATALGATDTPGTRTTSVPGATDVNVVINNDLGVELEFPTTVLGATPRNLFAEQQGAMFYSLAEMVNKVFLATMFSATWAGAATGNNAQALGANFGLPGVITIKTLFTLNKMPDMGRFALLHTLYHDLILRDSNLLSAKAILSLIKKDAGSFEDGELPTLFGVKVLESQLAAYNAAAASNAVATSMLGLKSPTDYATVATTAPDGIGFAGNSASAVLAARVPLDYTKAFPDIPATASIEIITEPDSGLSCMFRKYVNHTTSAVSALGALMFGIAQGDPRQGFVLKP